MKHKRLIQGREFDRGWCWKPFPNYERVIFKRKPEWNYPQSGKWVKVKLVEVKG